MAEGEIAGVTACTDGKTLSVRLNKKELRKNLGFKKLLIKLMGALLEQH
jgi:hypothetical protein